MTTWPSVSFEERPWVSKYSRDLLTQRQFEDYRGPYKAAVVPQIAHQRVVVDSAVAADVDEASQALARFDAELSGRTSPFAAILLRSESASSSQIEQLTSDARAIAEAELGERETGNAALIVRNVRALQAAIALSGQISSDTIIAMQEALLGAHAPALTGAFRQEQVWIGSSPVGPHTADFVPPHHDRVPAAMDDLIAFTERNDVPVLTQVAISHAQFETIHPFPDGNGRTGRALVQAMMRERALTTNVTVPVSAGLLNNVQGYYAALTSYRSGNVDPIVEAFANAAIFAVGTGRILAAEIAEVSELWEARMAGLRSDATARRVAQLALEQPVLNQQVIASKLAVVPGSAYRALDELEKRGVLHSANSKKRNRIWIADDVIGALDAFADRAGRGRN